MNFLNFPIPYFVLSNAELKLLLYSFYQRIYSDMHVLYFSTGFEFDSL